MTFDWDTQALATLDSLFDKIAKGGKGCTQPQYVGRDTLLQSRAVSNADLPIALGLCDYGGVQIEILTYKESTKAFRELLQLRIDNTCGLDRALGRIDGDHFVIIAGSTIAEAVSLASGGTLADTACSGS